jgi:hypothetical protein
VNNVRREKEEKKKKKRLLVAEVHPPHKNYFCRSIMYDDVSIPLGTHNGDISPTNKYRLAYHA